MHTLHLGKVRVRVRVGVGNRRLGLGVGFDARTPHHAEAPLQLTQLGSHLVRVRVRVKGECER